MALPRCLLNAIRTLAESARGSIHQQQKQLAASTWAQSYNQNQIVKRNLTTNRRHLQPVTGSKKSTAKLPLDGILVVALEQAIAGPFCTRQLADLGARVIKIERPGLGDFNRHHDDRVEGMCSHFVWTNRSKESLALDLKNPLDLDALKKILVKADVLVQNLAPGATDRMGLSWQTLKKTIPGLIVCDISGYGSKYNGGPKASSLMPYASFRPPFMR